MAGSFPKDPGQILPLTSGSRPYYALIDGSGGAVAFEREWTIGNMGDDYGYHAVNAYGGLAPDDWFNLTDTVDVLIVDDSATAILLQSDVSSMWGVAANVTLVVEGFGDVILTWNGSTSYINVGDSAFVNYIIGQNGNSLGLNILPASVTLWFDAEAWTDSEQWTD